MYSTCLYCAASLGTNDVLETLPIGRRVAFDESTGRLWVVCHSCHKWNLVPFDTRLETIDACERLFRDARLRYSTDHIGIARLGEGLELVRIGKPERQEYAAWRYGDQFKRRRVTSALVYGGALTVMYGSIAINHLGLAAIGTVTSFATPALVWAMNFRVFRRARGSIGGPTGGIMTFHQSKQSTLTVDDEGALSLEVPVFPKLFANVVAHGALKTLRVTGDDVIPMLGRILPHINETGGNQERVRTAVDLMQSTGSPLEMVRNAPAPTRSERRITFMPANIARRIRGQPLMRAVNWKTDRLSAGVPFHLSAFPAPALLAMEMSAHEETERAALSGELKLLEREWKEADQLARIADQLVLEDE